MVINDVARVAEDMEFNERAHTPLRPIGRGWRWRRVSYASPTPAPSYGDQHIKDDDDDESDYWDQFSPQFYRVTLS